MSRQNRPRISRRSLLRVTGASGVVGTTSMLAGCSGGGGGNEQNQTSEKTGTEGGTEEKGASGQVQTGGTIKIALQSDPWTMHPHMYQDTSSSQLAVNFGNTLVTTDSKGKILPDLAKEVPKPQDGGKKYVFTLHEGVKFHGDYGEMKAKDVVANYQKILDEKYGSPARADYEGVLVGEGVDPKKSVQATGEYEVTFNLGEPYAPFLYKFADGRMTVIPPEVIKKHGKNLGNPDVGIWATGPFQFVEASSSDHYTFKKNPNYFKKGEDGKQLPYLDKVVFRVAPESSVRTTQIKTGGIHVSEMVPARDVKKLESDDNVVLKSQPGASNINLYVNKMTFEPLSKKEVRKALAYAVNQQAIIAAKFNGLAVEGKSIFPSWHWAYDESAVTTYKNDPQKAKQMLQDAGEAGLKFNCSPTNQPLFVDTAQILQQNFRQAGVNMEITPKEKSAAWEPTIDAWDPKAFKPKGKVGPPSDFNSLVEDITYGFDADGYSYITFHTESWLNVSYYSNDQVDKWLEQARKTTDRNERKKLYSKAQGKITEDIPQIFLPWWNVNQAYRTSVGNFKTYPTFEINLEEVWLKQN